MLQEVFIYILVALALFFIGKRVLDMLIHKKTPGCAECGAAEPGSQIKQINRDLH